MGEQPDEDELDAELEGLEQEAMDERMLKTGTVPVNDQVNRLPAAANGESKSTPIITLVPFSNNACFFFQSKRRRNKPRRKTRKQSSKSSVQKWPCDAAVLPLYIVGFPF